MPSPPDQPADPALRASSNSRARSPSAPPRMRRARTIAGTANVAARIRSARTNSAAMTHPEARADAGFAAARRNESRTSLRARGHSTSGDRDVEAADRAAARPPTSPPAGHGRKAAPGSDTANPTGARPPVPTHSHTATPTDRPPKRRAPSWSEERDGESEPTLPNSTYVEMKRKPKVLSVQTVRGSARSLSVKGLAVSRSTASVIRCSVVLEYRHARDPDVRRRRRPRRGRPRRPPDRADRRARSRHARRDLRQRPLAVQVDGADATPAAGWATSSSASSRPSAATCGRSRPATWSSRRSSGRTAPASSAARACRANACTAAGTASTTSTAARARPCASRRRTARSSCCRSARTTRSCPRC